MVLGEDETRVESRGGLGFTVGGGTLPTSALDFAMQVMMKGMGPR